jgi:carbonic anhydrase
MSVTDELLRNAEQYAADFAKGDLPLPPAKQLAVVACMDARLIPTRVLGLEEGDAHVIRNAGGVVTDDEIRSLSISQRLLGTREIVLIHHTDCGMLTFTDDEFKRSVQKETGIKPEWAAEAFDDLDETSASRSPASRPAPSSPTRTPCAASSTKSRRDACARSRRSRASNATPRRREESHHAEPGGYRP